MRNKILTVISLVVVLAMLLAPTGSTGTVAAKTLPPGRTPEKVPQAIKDAFKDGMSLDEFLAQNKGPIPWAVMQLIDEPVTVVVEMEQPSLIASMTAAGKSPQTMLASAQRSYAQGLLAAQAPLVAEVQARGGVVLGQYTKTYNGVLVKAAGKDIAALRKIPGVKAVHRAPVHTAELGASVPLINADDVWALGPGADGTGVTIAIIDTGIDYTHAAFGGVGTAAAYAANDPNIIEPGSFPTAKVIGGYDFAGTAYNANIASSIPVPDDDPLDEAGHGSHVASIAAGNAVPGSVAAGVAPGASLYALKVFGAAGSTNLVVNALEWAMDPNGDGDLSDHVDVVNMSLGSPWGAASPDNADVVASNMAVALGVVVVASAGNEGDSSYVTGSPAVADKAISVAASTTGFVTLPTVKYGAGSSVPYMPGNAFDTAITAELADVDAFDGTGTGLLCDKTAITPADALAGKIALVQRGTCGFAVKIQNADDLGALGVIVYNSAIAANEFVSMLTAPATLPAGFTIRSYGLELKANAAGTTVTVGPDSEVTLFPFGNVDNVASFSSRGPRGYDSKLKPEVTAPGVNIYAAAMGSGDLGTSLSGTSMAAPHVAGVAALLLAAHPGYTPEQVKAAIMSTAVDLDLADVNAYHVVPRTGAGRVDALAAVTTTSLAAGDPDLVSLSWGLVQVGVEEDPYIVPESKLVRLTNNTGADKTYNISVTFTDPAAGAGATLIVPATVNVANGATAGVPVVLQLDPELLPLQNSASSYPENFGVMEEYYGFITFTPQGGGNAVRLPFYFVPRPYTTLVEQPGAYKNVSIHGPGVDYAAVNFLQTGPKESNLWIWPALVVDPNEPGISDEGDLRAAGMDYYFTDTTEGDIISVAIANYGPLHDLQPYFDETDLYIDTDRDGVDDWVLFNYNFGEANGGDPTNEWVVLAVDLATGETYLGSPYYIFADFNSGIQEWWTYAISPDPLDYTFFSYDSAGNQDTTPKGSFVYVTSPFAWDISDYTPGNGETTTILVGVSSPANFLLERPKGVILFDYYGKPGMGQAYVITLNAYDVGKLYMPVIGK